MNILFLSDYGKSDPRTRAFIHVMRALGNTVCVTREVPEKTTDVDGPTDALIHNRGINGLVEFVKLSMIAARGLKTIDLLFIDNRMATIPGRLIARIFHPKFVVQDAMEFYTFKETRHLVGKIGCILEDSALRKADVVFCANSHRAEAMKSAFRLRDLPYVFENVFSLSYDSGFSETKAKEQYGSLFTPDQFTFLSSSGCSVPRTTDRLVLAMESFKGKAQLLLVGRNLPADEKKIRTIIEQKGLNNVHILGRVDKNTLKWLIQLSDAGVAIYGKSDSNNLFCASGKIYEFLSEGLPFMASDNPPLLSFCRKTNVGYASDDYENALREVLENYSVYRHNVEQYMNSFDMRTAWHDAEDMLREKFVVKTTAMNR